MGILCWQQFPESAAKSRRSSGLVRHRWSLMDCSGGTVSPSLANTTGLGDLGRRINTHPPPPPLQLLCVATLCWRFDFFIVIFLAFRRDVLARSPNLAARKKKNPALVYHAHAFCARRKWFRCAPLPLCCSRGVQGGSVSYILCATSPVSVAKLDGRVKRNITVLFSPYLILLL